MESMEEIRAATEQLRALDSKLSNNINFRASEIATFLASVFGSSKDLIPKVMKALVAEGKMDEFNRFVSLISDSSGTLAGLAEVVEPSMEHSAEAFETLSELIDALDGLRKHAYVVRDRISAGLCDAICTNHDSLPSTKAGPYFQSEKARYRADPTYMVSTPPLKNPEEREEFIRVLQTEMNLGHLIRDEVLENELGKIVKKSYETGNPVNEIPECVRRRVRILPRVRKTASGNN